MTVILAPRVEDELLDIYRWTVRRFGRDQADRYDAFLRTSFEELNERRDEGVGIDGHPELRRRTFKLHNHGNGHIAVYQVDEDAGLLEVLRLFRGLAAVPYEDGPAHAARGGLSAEVAAVEVVAGHR